MRGRYVFLTCDHEDCETDEYPGPWGGTTFAELESAAKAEGWTVHLRGEVHFCPEHARKRLTTVAAPRIPLTGSGFLPTNENPDYT